MLSMATMLPMRSTLRLPRIHYADDANDDRDIISRITTDIVDQRMRKRTVTASNARSVSKHTLPPPGDANVSLRALTSLEATNAYAGEPDL